MKEGVKLENKRDTHWYVYLHKSTRANEIVAEALMSGPGSEDRLRRDVECADGGKRDLWRVSHPELRKIRIAGSDLNFKVTVYVEREGGKPTVWVDPNRARYRKRLLKQVRSAA